MSKIKEKARSALLKSPGFTRSMVVAEIKKLAFVLRWPLVDVYHAVYSELGYKFKVSELTSQQCLEVVNLVRAIIKNTKRDKHA